MTEQIINPSQTKTDVGRIATLRNQLLETKPRVCVERARLMTEAYRQNEADPPVLRRSKAFAHTLDKMSIYILDGELIVENRSGARCARLISHDQFPVQDIDAHLIESVSECF